MLLLPVIQQLVGTVARMTPQLAFIAFIVAAMVFFGQRFGFFGDTIQLAPTSAANLVAGEGREVELFTLLPKDGIRSIDAPPIHRRLGGRLASLNPRHRAPDQRRHSGLSAPRHGQS